MAILKIARTLIFAVCAFAPVTLLAEDIDLFKGGTPITGQKPNVLIIVDNTVNWNNNANHWPGGKQAQEELEALSTVVGSLTGDVRVGLMMINSSAGYVRFGLRDMDATNRTGFQQMLAGMAVNTGNNDVPTSQGDYGALMYEAWKYFSGATNAVITSTQRDYAGNGSVNVSTYTAGNLAGNPLSSSTSSTYINPLSSSQPCNKNFIIFIGNGFPSTSSTDPSSLSVTGWTSADSVQIFDEGTKTTYLDEWARFLHKTGVANKPCDTSVSPAICADNLVTTYTIDVFKDKIDTPQSNLLKSTAAVGGGKYFAATSKAEISSALTKIINEIQAVNSVFTSASLPVSVNTQGTYLNQIYMGVFRPDGAGAPRWLGNLKQYKFGLTTDATGNETIFLADADGNAAVNALTGFVDPSARSYWSKSTTPSAGYWAFSPSGPGGQYDSPDGDLVEKGGAAQKLRDLGPTARTVYTCTACAATQTPDSFSTSNTGLVTALTGTSSAVTSLTRISTTATAITASDLLLASPTDSVSISGASVAGYNGSFTATKGAGNTFTFPVAETPVTPATGAAITVSAGTSVAQSVSAGAMTNTIGTNGKVNVNLPAHGFINNQSVTIAGANVSAGMAAATTKCAGYAGGGTAPVNNCEYNGTYNITYVDANNFTYVPLTANLGSNTATSTVIDPPDPVVSPFGNTVIDCRSGSTTTTTTVSNSAISRVAGGAAGATKLVSVAMSSVPAACANPLVTSGNGRVTAIRVADTNSPGLNITPGTVSYGAAACGTGMHFCYNVTLANITASGATTTLIPASPATGTVTATGIPTRAVTSITRTAGNASNVATVTVTTAVDHGFGASSSVTIAGADQTEYNGTKTTASNGLVIPGSSNQFTFTLTTGPTTPATGATAAKGSSVDPATLINWVRGVDNKEDENANASLTDCRPSIHGDVLHSRPLVVNYGDAVGIYAFYGSNDGTFRAVKAGQDEGVSSLDGKEAWSFVAPEHYSNLGRLYNNTPLIKYAGQSAPNTPRNYFFDGNIGVFQSANLATTHIFISMRRGGRAIYALDVSSPTAPKFLWKKTNTDTGFSELGQTWSEPKVIALKKSGFTSCNTSHSGLSTDATSSYTRALVFGAGYDPTSDDTTSGSSRPVATMGRGVFVLKAEDGSLIKLLEAPADDFKGLSNSARRYPIPGDVTLLDTDGDGCTDRVYAGDTGAKLHRFDLNDVDPNNWKAYTLATLGDSGNNGGSNDRKILYAPEAVLSFLNGQQIVYLMFGTGNREEPSSNAVNDRFYMIRDSVAVGTNPATTTSTSVTNSAPGVTPVVGNASYVVRESQLDEVTNFNSATTTIDATAASFKGWYLDYETGEKSVNAALTVAGTTFFGTNKPKAVDPRSCEPNLGIARGYALNFLNGTASVGDRDGNGTINKTDLYSVFKGGGLPPSPVSGVVQISPGKTVRFVIGSGGSGTTGSAIEGVKTQVNPSGTRTRVFWYFKKDD